MTRRGLIAQVTEATGLSKSHVESVVNIFCDSIMEALAAGEEVRLKGFGTFEVFNTPQRSGRNPKSGETTIIPAGRRVRFKIGKNLKDRIMPIRID